jgi:UTP--glucose-1-phosphate uridylyltransferase
MTKLPTKAVIAAAGFGTRFLPQTKAMPKEMLPLVDKPIIQHVVEELVSVGIKDIIIVTGQAKRAIEDHFDSPTEDLIVNLRLGGPKKEPLLKMVQDVSQMANFVYVRQKGPYGNGTPLMNVAHLIGDEPFIYTWSDDFIDATPSRFQQLIDVYKKYQGSVLAGIQATKDGDYSRYGFAAGTEVEDGIIDTTAIVEKPGKENAPSDLATVSGFLLTPDVFDYLRKAQEQMGETDELYYNDALKLMLQDGKKVYAAKIKDGRYYDAGDKLEYMKTVVDFALRREDIGEDFRKHLERAILADK